jgi:hypothetical protein
MLNLGFLGFFFFNITLIYYFKCADQWIWRKEKKQENQSSWIAERVLLKIEFWKTIAQHKSQIKSLKYIIDIQVQHNIIRFIMFIEIWRTQGTHLRGKFCQKNNQSFFHGFQFRTDDSRTHMKHINKIHEHKVIFEKKNETQRRRHCAHNPRLKIKTNLKCYNKN